MFTRCPEMPDFFALGKEVYTGCGSTVVPRQPVCGGYLCSIQADIDNPMKFSSLKFVPADVIIQGLRSQWEESWADTSCRLKEASNGKSKHRMPKVSKS